MTYETKYRKQIIILVALLLLLLTGISTQAQVAYGAPPSNPDLQMLTLSNGTLSPVFASNVLSYTAQVANNITQVYVTPTAVDSRITITVNGVAATSGQAFGPINLNVGNNTITVFTSASKGGTKTYTVTVNRAASANANLSMLTVNPGNLAPAFSTDVLAYSVSVDYGTTSIDVNPTVQDSSATVKVNGVAVMSGTPRNVNLNIGNNVISVVVTAQNATTTKTYTVNVNRAASANANLSMLTVNQGSLTPAFSTDITTYSLAVDYSTASIAVTPTVQDSSATVKVNGVTGTNGSPSNVNLNVGNNVVSVLVTAGNGTTTKNYTVDIHRAAPGINTNLSELAVSSGNLSPAFTPSNNTYMLEVDNEVSSIIVTATLEDNTASLRVNGLATTSGESITVNLAEGNNEIAIEVTAQDGIAKKIYIITVERVIPGPVTVRSSFPANNAINVPEDQQIVISFSKDILPGLEFNKIVMKKGKAKVKFSVEYMGRDIKLTPLEGLLPNNLYTVEVPAYAVKDSVGYGLGQPYVLTFRTPDNIAPTVKSANPKAGKINVALNQVITIKFSEEIKAGPDFAEVKLNVNGVEVPCAKSLERDTLTLEPTDDLANNQVYTVVIPANGVNDMANNPLQQDFDLNFTSVVDKIKPTILSSNPDNLAAEVPVDQPITLTCSEDIVEGPTFGSIALKLGTTMVDCEVVLSGRTLTITPNEVLAEASQYILLVPAGAVTDQAGNSATYSLKFTTSDPRPNVVGTNPENKALYVPSTQEINIVFDEEVMEGPNVEGITLKKGTVTVEFSYSISGDTVVIKPIEEIETDSVYNLVVPEGAFQDADGNEAEGCKLIFNTVETVAPVIVSTYPLDQKLNIPIDKAITVKFSEDIVPGDNWDMLSLKFDSETVPFSKTIEGKVLTIKPENNMVNAGGYTVSIPAGAVKDLSGNALGEDKAFSFTTVPDKVKPVIENCNIPNMAVNVSLNQGFILKFTEDIQEGVNFNKIQLKSGKITVPWTAVAEGNTLTLTPVGTMEFGAKTILTIPGGAVADLVGNTNKPYKLTFFTLQAAVAPTVTVSEPANGALDVEVTDNMQLTFNATVVKGVNFKYISLKDAATSTSVPVSVIVVDNKVIIDPKVNLVAGNEYELYLPVGAFKDVAGNPSVSFNLRFTSKSA